MTCAERFWEASWRRSSRRLTSPRIKKKKDIAYTLFPIVLVSGSACVGCASLHMRAWNTLTRKDAGGLGVLSQNHGGTPDAAGRLGRSWRAINNVNWKPREIKRGNKSGTVKYTYTCLVSAIHPCVCARETQRRCAFVCFSPGVSKAFALFVYHAYSIAWRSTVLSSSRAVPFRRGGAAAFPPF